MVHSFLLTIVTVTVTVARMLFKRICPLAECGLEFDTDNPRKEFCTLAHSKVGRVRRHRAKNRKPRGGGGGGNGGGGGSSPNLFGTITPVNSREAFVSIPVIGPSESDRKPSQKVLSSDDQRAA